MGKNKAITKICVKFFTVGNKRSSTSIIKARKGKVFTKQGIAMTIDLMSRALKRRVPGENFRLVCLSVDRYNFLWDSTVVAESVTMPHLFAEGEAQLEVNEHRIVLDNGGTIEFGPDTGEVIRGLSDFGEATVEVGDGAKES